MGRDEIKYRPCERTAYCRGCDKELSKGDMMVTMYSYRNHGQHIHLCSECIRHMNDLIDEYNIKEETVTLPKYLK